MKTCAPIEHSNLINHRYIIPALSATGYPVTVVTCLCGGASERLTALLALKAKETPSSSD